MYKRILQPVLWVMILALCLCTGCRQKEKEPETKTFQAVITEIGNGSMLVTPIEGSAELSSSNSFRIAIQNMPSSPEPRVGDTVEIVYKGGILETYPAGLEEIVSITVVAQVPVPDEAPPEEAPQDADDLQEETESEAQAEAEEPTEEPGPGAAEVTGPYGTVSVKVPENWTWEACPVDTDKLMYGYYGILLKPAEAQEGQIELIYHDSFAVCGTGLKEEEITLADGPALVGIYDQNTHWDFIIYHGSNDNVVAQHTDCTSWTDAMWDEALEILDTVRLDPDKKSGGIWQYSPECENDDIALIMDMRHVTPSGATVRFTQYDDQHKDELIYGEGFYLEKQDEDGWYQLPMIIDDAVFTDEGYVIPPGGESEIETEWAWLYGELEPGTYRICKTVWKGQAMYFLFAQFILA